MDNQQLRARVNIRAINLLLNRRDDLNRLAEKFGIEIPAEIVRQRSEASSRVSCD